MMKKRVAYGFGIPALLSLAVNLSTDALAQQGQLTDVTIEGHIYEPQRLAPTSERVGNLRVAAGSSVQQNQSGTPHAIESDGRRGRSRSPLRTGVEEESRNLLLALDTTLDLPDGFNRHALLEAMRGHVLASGEFVGTYQQPE